MDKCLPTIRNRRTLLPARWLGTAFGWKCFLGWHREEVICTVENTIELWIGKPIKCKCADSN
ncbi:MAG: hypothetical protein R2883_03920 [Caldisericia bacterium]